jgi:hypothetical protein
MDFDLETFLAAFALFVALRTAVSGRPGPSLLIAAVAALNGLTFMIRPNPHGDMFLTWIVFILAGICALVALGIARRKESAEPAP